MRDPVKIAGILPGELAGLAKQNARGFKSVAEKIRAGSLCDSSHLDEFIHAEHERQFADIDCLDCANCCKTTPALVVQDDIDRIAGHLQITAGEFMTEYIEMDEDGDYVINRTPCPFLEEDHKCSIYEVRPKACREYPLTLRKNQRKILLVTLDNTSVCPAVFRIFQRLEANFDSGKD